jgi:PAS domain S-box-containing protein
MHKRILDQFILPYTSRHEEELVSRWLQTVFIAALAVLACYAGLVYFIGFDASTYIFIGTFIVIFSGLLVLLQRGHVRLVSLLFNFSAMGGLLFAAYRFGGVRSPSYNALIIVIILSALFLRSRMTVFATSISIVAGLLLYWAEMRGLYQVDQAFLSPFESWFSSVMTFIIAAVLLGIASRQVRYAFMRTAQEIVERSRVEETLRETARRQAALHETTVAIINRLELLPLLESILAHAEELAATENGYIDLLMPGSKGVQQAVGHGVFGPYNGQIIPPGQGVSGQVLATGAMQVIENYPQWPNHLPAYASAGFQAIAAVPLIVDGRIVGIIGMAHTAPGQQFSQSQLDMLEQFAELAALAIENARLYQSAQDEINERKRAQEALQRSEENLHLALEAAHMGTWDWEFESSTIHWSESAYKIFGVTPSSVELTLADYFNIIHLADQKMIQARISASLANPHQDYEVEHRILWPDGSVRWVEEKGKVFIAAGGHPARMTGTVTDITERKEAEEALRWANTRLQQDTVMLERRSTLLQVATEVSRAASAILDPAKLGQKVVDLVRNRFGLYYVGLFLSDNQDEYALLSAASGKAGKAMLESGHKLPLGNTSMIGGCIVDRQPRIALDVGAEAVRFNNPLLPRTRSELALPLITRGQTIGAISIQSAEEAAFSHEDIATFQTMADQLANAIMNARLYEQLQKELEERKRAEEEVRLLNAELEQRVQTRTADLRRSEETFRALTENNPVRIRRYDREGRYLYANRAGENDNSLPEEVIGKRIREVIHDPALVALSEACIRQVFETGQPLNTEYQIGASYASWWLAPEFGPDGQVISVVTSAIDITERKRIEEDLRQRSAELQATNRELEAFSYSVSHDLRAPLRAVDGFSRILKEDFGQHLPEAAKPILDRISDASHQMGQLIDDMLRLSRITRAELHENPVNLSGLVHSILNDLQLRDPGRDITLDIDENLQAKGDERLLRVALENLLNNAWKFTGKVSQAQIRVGKQVEKSGTVFYIKDNGVGFDMLYVDKLFGAFQRLHSSDEFPGTGIGLAIVQRVIHKHGGRVWAESEKGRGATFYFTL